MTGKHPAALWIAFATLLAGCDGRPSIPEPWTGTDPSPIPRAEAAAEVVDGLVYVFGGFTDTLLTATTRADVYDPRTDTWRRLADMPSPVTHVVPAVAGRSIWIAGGFEGSHPGRAVASVWVYDLDADSWRAGPDLPEPRAGGGLARVGRELHFVGGFDATRDSTMADHWALSLDDPAAWRPRAPLPVARGHLGTATTGGTLYVIGGQTRHDTYPVDHADVHAYDAASDRWEEIAPMPHARSHSEAAVFVHRDRIFVFGGRDNPNEGWTLSDGVYYDLEDGQWHETYDLPASLLGTIVRPLGDRLYVMTGSEGDWNRPVPSAYSRPFAEPTADR